MLDTHAVARTLTDAEFTPAQADAITNAVRQAADQGDHVTSDQFKAWSREGGRLLLPSAGLPPAVLRQFAWHTTARQRNLDLSALVATMLRAPEPIVPDVFGLPPPPASRAAPERAH